MANFVFGDVTEIVCQHISGTYRYYPKANESFTIDRGGIRGNDDANQVTSDGQMMSQLNRVRWSIEGPIAVDMILDSEISSLNVLAASPSMGTWSISNIAGVTYRGIGRPIGDIQLDTNAGTLTLKLAGNRELEKIT